MRVLLVDDEAAFVDPLAERLALRGVDAVVAHDAEEAQNRLVAESFDLAFLDVGLPGMDGVSLARLLRERYPELVLVMLSGAADMRGAVEAMRYGAQNWLSKPVAVDALLAECQRAQSRGVARQQAERLAEAAQLQRLGRVAQGVAHEVNNPLNTMMHAAGLIEDFLEDPAVRSLPGFADLQDAVAAIQAQSLRVREITRKLLIVGRGLDDHVAPLDVSAVLDGVLGSFADRLAAQGVRVARNFPPEAEAVRPLASARELEQICRHIVENALDAMPGGGELHLVARIVPGGEDRPDLYKLSFADSGPGIAPDVMPHIFEPFFSTHESRQGQHAGLGLAVAWSLARVRGGELEAENRPGGGALFHLLLPLPPRLDAAAPHS